VEHVDVDEVDAELHARDAALLHLLEGRLRELADLLRRRRTRRAFDPGVGPADVLFRDPRRMALDLKSEVALLEKDRPIVTAQHRVSQTRLEAVPSRRERASEVADVLVVHAEHRAEAVRLHALPRALEAVFPHAIPIDPLLPIKTCNSEIRTHSSDLASVAS